MITYNNLPEYARLNPSQKILIDLKDKFKKIEDSYQKIKKIELNITNDEIEQHKKIYNRIDRNFIDLSKLFIFSINILKNLNKEDLNNHLDLFDDLKILPLLLDEYKRKKDYFNGDRYEKMIISLVNPYAEQMTNIINVVLGNVNSNPFSLDKLMEISKKT